MFPSSSSAGVAVHHYSSWSAINWFVGYGMIFFAVLLAAVAAMLWNVAKSSDDDLGVVGFALAASALSAIVGSVAFWQVARHIESYKWVIALGLVIVATTTVLCHEAASGQLAEAAGAGRYYARRPALTYLVPAGVSAALVIGVIIGDAANRLAASIPMAVGTFVAFVLLGGIGLAAYAWSSSATR